MNYFYPMIDVLLITCEHGGNKIPDQYRHLFQGADSVLQTHRGFDIGALEMALFMAQELNCDFFYSIISRLLIEQNRSPDSPELFSDFTNALPENEKQSIIKQFYDPYRKQVDLAVKNNIYSDKNVLHLSIHTFTPCLNGKIRKADIGILFDESRKKELAFSQKLKKRIKKLHKEYNVRKNYPYKGTDDGLTKWLREKYPANYMGIELEINSKLCENRESWNNCQQVITEAVKRLLKK
jgi:predicted N-formylglutamate amidohydrolase